MPLQLKWWRPCHILFARILFQDEQSIDTVSAKIFLYLRAACTASLGTISSLKI